jgi:hypothetical protein
MAAAEGAMDGANARLVLLTCHRVLAACRDERAGRMLQSAHEALQRGAATISDPARRESCLARIAEHAEIVAAWQQAHGGC